MIATRSQTLKYFKSRKLQSFLSSFWIWDSQAFETAPKHKTCCYPHFTLQWNIRKLILFVKAYPGMMQGNNSFYIYDMWKLYCLVPPATPSRVISWPCSVRSSRVIYGNIAAGSLAHQSHWIKSWNLKVRGSCCANELVATLSTTLSTLPIPHSHG